MWIGEDLDGVWQNFADGLRYSLTQLKHPAAQHPKFNDPVQEWDFFRHWGIDGPEFKRVCDAGVDAGYIFTHGEPLADPAISNRLYDAGHKITFITDRPFGADEGKASRRATFKWLRQYGFKFHDVIFTADKGKVPVDVMIDDKIQNYDEMDASGTRVYLLNQPWNAPYDDHRRRVDSVQEWAHLVEELTYAF